MNPDRRPTPLNCWDILSYWPFKRIKAETIEKHFFAPGVKVDFNGVDPLPPLWMSPMPQSIYEYHVLRITAMHSPELGRRLSQPEVDSLSRLAGDHVAWWSHIPPALLAFAAASAALGTTRTWRLLSPARNFVRIGHEKGYNSDALSALLLFIAIQGISCPFILKAQFSSRDKVLHDPDLAWYREEAGFESRGLAKWRRKYVAEQWKPDLPKPRPLLRSRNLPATQSLGTAAAGFAVDRASDGERKQANLQAGMKNAGQYDDTGLGCLTGSEPEEGPRPSGSKQESTNSWDRLQSKSLASDRSKQDDAANGDNEEAPKDAWAKLRDRASRAGGSG